MLSMRKPTTIVEQLNALSAACFAASDLATRLSDADPNDLSVEELEEFLRQFDEIVAETDAVIARLPKYMGRLATYALQSMRQEMSVLRESLYA